MITARILVTALAVGIACIIADRSVAQVPGDYNHDGVLDAADLDLQAIAMKEGNHPLEFDLTKDGWVNFEDRLAWVADLKHTWTGDANLDLQYTSGDMVQVFAASTYETGRAANWASGDWDGNAVFDSSDMVAAFADGGYECGLRLVGDYNRNRQLDAGDLDLQAIEMVRGEHPAPYDLNHDSRVDFADRQVWVNDLKKTWMYDANLDGVLNSSDLVQVFAAGKYETGKPAGWAEGDFNGDTRFNSGDLVRAFVNGGYEKAPAVAVPEPTSALLIAMSLIGLAIFRCPRGS